MAPLLLEPKFRSHTRLAWVLIGIVFAASVLTWFFRDGNSWLTVVMWIAGATVGVFGLLTAVRERRLGLGIAAVATIFADPIVFGVMFAGAMVVQGGFAP